MKRGRTRKVLTAVQVDATQTTRANGVVRFFPDTADRMGLELARVVVGPCRFLHVHLVTDGR